MTKRFYIAGQRRDHFKNRRRWENARRHTRIFQRPTNAQNGRDAVISGWISAIGAFLAENKLDWSQVQAVGLAIPVRMNATACSARRQTCRQASRVGMFTPITRGAGQGSGRPLPLTVGNDGHLRRRAEARIARADKKNFRPDAHAGSGLAARSWQDGLPLTGQTLTAWKPRTWPAVAPVRLSPHTDYSCGCARLGCVEPYTTIAGLPHLLAEKLLKYPATNSPNRRAGEGKVLSLRSRRKRATRWR